MMAICSFWMAAYFNPRPLAGATIIIYQCDEDTGFQSTPPRGGDDSPGKVLHKSFHFNPRPLAGATTPASGQRKSFLISIHAPSRGRPELCRYSISSKTFQSTPPRGGDEVPLAPCRIDCDFNPRPLAGATDLEGVLDCDLTISIHAPSRGRRRHTLATLLDRAISIHAPSRGRLAAVLRRSRSSRFQSTPPRGGDGGGRFKQQSVVHISIHAPSRGRPFSYGV